MDKIRTLRFFVATLERGSFAAAAKKYGTDPSTVSKALHRLESELGIQLFQRSTRQLNLTSAGHQYARTARLVLDELSACEEALQQSNRLPSGTLKVNLPVSYGRRYIQPLLANFRQLYPNIALEIQFDDAYLDMIEHGIDVSIRSGSVQDSQLIARQLSPIDYLICASHDYLNQHGAPRGPHEFHHHSWIRFRFKQTGRLLGLKLAPSDEAKLTDIAQNMVVNDGESMAELCAQGLGLTQIPHFIARDWIKAGEITPLFPSFRPRDEGVYILYHRREHVPLRVKLFVDFVVESIQAQGESPRRTWVSNLDAFAAPQT
ncbi:LysR family transcriptional regulator [Vibrio coralliilyticus]|uniref:LysR family transcriptional regulator n=1 Tax=Vibrio coralliilyticus TaxID=190893 RepID=UPI0015615F5C|nr:LysR family transcriptional regulator [Vibrio coralliilyticus]NRF16424.1 LysR family transcriptional regulator [Vibrio coralliilyticus]